MLKWLSLFVVLGLSVASAKSYEVILASPAKVGTMELKAGKYTLSVMDDKTVRFKDANGNEVETTATITAGDKKFENTLVDTTNVNGGTQIREIDLGGTKTKIQFQ